MNQNKLMEAIEIASEAGHGITVLKNKIADDSYCAFVWNHDPEVVKGLAEEFSARLPEDVLVEVKLERRFGLVPKVGIDWPIDEDDVKF